MRGPLLSLFILIGLTLGTQPALASCARQAADDIARRGDVAATGVVSSFVPLGFIFAVDRVYKGEVPAHVFVVGQYRPPDPYGSRQFVVMRSHLPGIYSMDVCDGLPIGDVNLGALGDGRVPSADLPVLPVAVGLLLVLLLLLGRRGRGKPAAPAAATAYYLISAIFPAASRSSGWDAYPCFAYSRRYSGRNARPRRSYCFTCRSSCRHSRSVGSKANTMTCPKVMAA